MEQNGGETRKSAYEPTSASLWETGTGMKSSLQSMSHRRGMLTYGLQKGSPAAGGAPGPAGMTF